jgi:hypothetical protein
MSLIVPLRRRAVLFFTHLSARERLATFVSIAAIAAFALFYAVESVQGYMTEREINIVRRKGELQNLIQMLGRFTQRQNQLLARRDSFEQSQMTFEEVTSELDKIVRESIGSDNYDLKRSETGSSIGIDFEKQDFTLRVRSLNIEQLVSLLFRVESGTSPLFLGKVDLIRAGRPDDFSATLEVFSIRRKAA